MHTKFERLLSKSLTTMEVMAYDPVVHTGPDVIHPNEKRRLSLVEIRALLGQNGADAFFEYNAFIFIII